MDMSARKREIGSEFWEVPTAATEEGTLFPDTTQWFLSGRCALRSILRELTEAKTVALPSWCCESMIRPFIDAGMTVHFYPVYYRDQLIQEINTEFDILFVMDYFGYTSMDIDRRYPGIVIRDVTHSVFSKSYMDADYSFGSLRKWCGFWTGGFACTKDDHALLAEGSEDYGYVSLREKAMQWKGAYINGKMDAKKNGIEDKGYLKVYEEAEKLLDAIEIAPAAERDILLARRMDTEFVKARRRANAEVLRKAFSDWLLFPEMRASDCPMFVPILVPNCKRDALRHYLIEHEIYCPIHWPLSEYHRPGIAERELYDNELSLVCDQRYTEDDMDRMVETIRSFFKEG